MDSRLLKMARPARGQELHWTGSKPPRSRSPADDQPSESAGRCQVLRNRPPVALARRGSLPPLWSGACDEAGSRHDPTGAAKVSV